MKKLNLPPFSKIDDGEDLGMFVARTNNASPRQA